MEPQDTLRTAVVELECPWCEGALRVAETELAIEVRCPDCLIAFSLAEPAAAGLAVGAGLASAA
jgi:hypothetical protein